MKDDRVLFAAYKVEHPLFAKFVMRIQTEENYSPREALRNACNSVISQLDILRDRFKREWDLKSFAADGADYE